ncbi:MAG: hypothetical protein ACKVJG_18740 [Candidatus Latescibacterota bacterium]
MQSRMQSDSDTGSTCSPSFFGEVVAHWSNESNERSLLIVGEESGYETVHEQAGFRLGVVGDG